MLYYLKAMSGVRRRAVHLTLYATDNGEVTPHGGDFTNTEKERGDGLKTSDFYFDLPHELIAQTPAEPRDSSKLLKIDMKTGELEDHIFRDIEYLLKPGDTLVINDSKVIPARIYGNRADGDGGRAELLLVKHTREDEWECLIKPGRRVREGCRLTFGGGELSGIVTGILPDGSRTVSFSFDREKYGSIFAVLDEIGTMPTPPYITEKLEDKSRYQTVYAKTEGSAAAPTAGLHFTPELMARLEARDIKFVRIMLHIGLGTFSPVREENIADHVMHTEYYSVSKDAADTINSRRAAGGRTVCVGTTSCRTLETVANEDGIIVPSSGYTGIFISPGYKIKATDALITNFHLPESTLIMLVSAFTGREHILAAYKYAVEHKYRFFSFGDACLIC
ncbi:MAG: tRNA preQ1(34) S-adenosylmethionine ribosyltransferase-isomerase QueA [Firmicutes bacterium]|nr:tRNA preQ1(34) S-adenosylmethionine ribosyltransferase-isomerase QueA [Bacillota bacterium]